MNNQTEVKTRPSFGVLWQKYGTMGIFLLLLAVLTIAKPSSIFNPDSIPQILKQSAVNILLALGEFFAILIAGIDLSVGAVAGLVGMLTAMLMVNGIPVIPALLLGILIGTMIGFCNGMLVNKTGLHPFIITLGTLLYTLNKQRIPTRNLHGRMVCILIGFFLGASSSFLGIGGGPINLVVLFYFFSMDTKTAAQNSLYIILISQISSLLLTVLSGSVPPFSLPTLLGMAVCGVLGGIAGRCVNRRIPSATVDRLFIGMMGLILAICVYNYLRFT